jgi:hypothetical protein
MRKNGNWVEIWAAAMGTVGRDKATANGFMKNTD